MAPLKIAPATPSPYGASSAKSIPKLTFSVRILDYFLGPGSGSGPWSLALALSRTIPLRRKPDELAAEGRGIRPLPM